MHPRSLIDFQIVERDFARATGIETDDALTKSGFVDNGSHKLSVDVKVHLQVPDADFQLIGVGAGTNGGAGSGLHNRRLFPTAMKNNSILLAVVAVGKRRRLC